MAFDADKITKISNIAPADDTSPSLSLWHYKDAAAIATVVAAGYFNSYRDFLNVGDLIIAECSDGARFVKVLTVPKTGNVTTSQTAYSLGAVLPGLKFAAGQATTVTASDTVVTGLALVSFVVATLNDAPAAGVTLVVADIGTQAGAPAAGSFLLKTYKPTAAGDTTPIAATTFAKKVNWIAIGT